MITGRQSTYRTREAVQTNRATSTFHCRDREIIVVTSTDKQFGVLMRVLGEPSLASGARFGQVQSRIAHRGKLLTILDALFVERPASAWPAEPQAAEVPGSLVNDVAMMIAKPQVQRRQMLDHVHYPWPTTCRCCAIPFACRPRRSRTRHPPPVLGQDNEACCATCWDTTMPGSWRCRLLA